MAQSLNKEADRDNHVIVSSRDESRGAQISEPDLDSGL